MFWRASLLFFMYQTNRGFSPSLRLRGGDYRKKKGGSAMPCLGAERPCRGCRAAQSTANGRAGTGRAPKGPRSGGRGDVAGRVAGVIGMLGRRHAPQGARGPLGAFDAAVGRRRRLAACRARGARKVTALSLNIERGKCELGKQGNLGEPTGRSMEGSAPFDE